MEKIELKQKVFLSVNSAAKFAYILKENELDNWTYKVESYITPQNELYYRIAIFDDTNTFVDYWGE